MKIIPKAYIINEIVAGIQKSVDEFVFEELQRTYDTLLAKGVSRTLAKEIIAEVETLL